MRSPAPRRPGALLAASLLAAACATGAPRPEEPAADGEDEVTVPQEAPEAPTGPAVRAGLEVPEAAPRSLEGRIRLACLPDDAEVVIDGVTRGLAADFAAPRFLELSEGAHRIELRKAGYATYRAEVVVSAEVLETIPVTLRRLPGAAPAQGGEATQEDG